MNENDTIDQELTKSIDLTHEPYKECNHIVIENNINNIKNKEWGDDGDDYMPDDL